MSRGKFLIAAILVALLQTAAIAGIMYKRAHEISTGQEVILESRFVDPRDLFRGHYVILNLNVGQLENATTEIDFTFKRQEDVFVELEEGENGFWVARKLWHEIPSDHISVFIKGKILRTPLKKTDRYQINFPQDRYFAPKKRAKELEKFRRDQQLGVILSIAPNGAGYIKGITIAGDRIYDEPLW
ncbi:MAG: GDYXXLXY domain-containing protein [Rhizobiaceae bacterium]|nr:GDYXXLXY domain-containing protein [Rhizobiaceae bacterium]